MSDDPWTFLAKQLWARTDEDGDIRLATFPEDPVNYQWLLYSSEIPALTHYLLHRTSLEDDAKLVWEFLAVWTGVVYEDDVISALDWSPDRVRRSVQELAALHRVRQSTDSLGRNMVFVQVRP